MFGDDFFQDYRRGMESLYSSAPIFANFSQALGHPEKTEEIPTAYVSYDKASDRVSFFLNPHYIRDLTDSQIGAVIAHETYHVLLQHLSEVADDASYPDRATLIEAHECIINDGLEDNVGLRLPDGCIYGTERHDQDFSWFTTRQGYDFLQKDKDDPEETDDSESDNGESDGESSGSGSGSSSDQTDGQNESGGGTGDSDSSADESEAGEDGSGGESTEGDKADGEGAAGGQPFHCSGPKVDPEDVDAFNRAAKKMIQDTLDDLTDPLPTDLSDALSDFDQKSFGLGDGGEVFVAKTDGMNLNWKSLLAVINPKVNSAGRNVPKANWGRIPRKLVSAYPTVVLPTREVNTPDPNKDGRDLPTLVVALDLSQSIPRHLVNDLVGLVDQVPTEHIISHPVTWAGSVVPWDPDRRMTASGGTYIDKLYTYVKNLSKEIGKDPYVLVITDGECSFEQGVDSKLLKEKWFWAGIRPNDVYEITRKFVQRGHADKNHVYKLDDFKS